MAYARFGGDSDVYVVFSIMDRYECLGCPINQHGCFETASAREMILHLEEHDNRGWKVPEYAFARLREDLWTESR